LLEGKKNELTRGRLEETDKGVKGKRQLSDESLSKLPLWAGIKRLQITMFTNVIKLSHAEQ